MNHLELTAVPFAKIKFQLISCHDETSAKHANIGRNMSDSIALWISVV